MYKRPDEIATIARGFITQPASNRFTCNQILEVEREQQRDDQQGERLIGEVEHAPRPDFTRVVESSKWVEFAQVDRQRVPGELQKIEDAAPEPCEGADSSSLISLAI